MVVNKVKRGELSRCLACVILETVFIFGYNYTYIITAFIVDSKIRQSHVYRSSRGFDLHNWRLARLHFGSPLARGGLHMIGRESNVRGCPVQLQYLVLGQEAFPDCPHCFGESPVSLARDRSWRQTASASELGLRGCQDQLGQVG